VADRARRAVVIGAGLGGLATASRLAVGGWRVTVCEQYERPGGKMNLWETGGYRFDTGPSLITMPWVFEELFHHAGTSLEAEGVELVPVRPASVCVFDDGTRVALDGRLPELLSAVRRLEGGDASGFLRFLALGARVYELSRATFFSRSPREGLDIRALRHLRRAPFGAFARSYRSLVRHCCGSAKVCQILERYTTYVGSDPGRSPAMLSVVPAMELLFGGWHVRGGLYRIIEALVSMLARAGVDLRTRTRVARIHRSGNRVAAVETEDGERLPCDVVVMNGDCSRLGALMGENGAGSLRESQRSLSGVVFLFAVRGRQDGWPHHQVAFSRNYEEEFRQLFDERRFPDDPTVYVCTPSRTDDRVAPSDGETVFVMANAPANDGDAWDETMIATARERMMARLDRVGLGGWRDRVVAEAVRTPRWMVDAYGMPGGAIYGQSSHGWRGAFLRPPNRVHSTRGLYAVGGSAHPGGGTPTVLLSARITCELIREHEER